MAEENKIEKTEQDARKAELSEQDLDQVAGGTEVVLEIAGRPTSGQGE
jgi:hypothetical protein